MKLKEYLSYIEKKLQVSYSINEAKQASWWILEAITGLDKAKLIALNVLDLSAQQVKNLNIMIEYIVENNMPLQYALGEVPFGNLILHVEPPILIPRPETEEWCYGLIDILKTYHNSLTILDLCTGSGCIALALAQAFPHAHIVATDINPKALALAKKNAIKNNIKNIIFLSSDLYETIHKSSFDLIVSNPPYISILEWQALAPHIKYWEDQQALIAQNDGLDLIAKIINNAQKYLRKNDIYDKKKLPRLAVEIGYQQGQAVAQLMKQAKLQTIIKKDAQGQDRVALGYICIK